MRPAEGLRLWLPTPPRHLLPGGGLCHAAHLGAAVQGVALCHQGLGFSLHASLKHLQGGVRSNGALGRWVRGWMGGGLGDWWVLCTPRRCRVQRCTGEVSAWVDGWGIGWLVSVMHAQEVSGPTVHWGGECVGGWVGDWVTGGWYARPGIVQGQDSSDGRALDTHSYVLLQTHGYFTSPMAMLCSLSDCAPKQWNSLLSDISHVLLPCLENCLNDSPLQTIPQQLIKRFCLLSFCHLLMIKTWWPLDRFCCVCFLHGK